MAMRARQERRHKESADMAARVVSGPRGLIEIGLSGFMGLKKVSTDLFECSDGAEFERLCWESGYVDRKPPRNVIRRIFLEEEWGSADIDWERTGTPMMRERIYPFQKRLVERSVWRGRSILVGDMGVGKTLCGGLFAVLGGGRALVLCPAVVLAAWERLFREWLGVEAVVLRMGKQAVCEGEGVWLCGYDLAKTHRGVLGSRWDTVVMDESHELCGLNSGRTSALVPLGQRAGRLLLLSGTPEKARPAELYGQLSMLDEGLFTREEYLSRYCEARQTEWGEWEYRGSENEEELHLLLSRYMSRVRSEDVLDLPPMSRVMVNLDVETEGLEEMRVEEKLVRDQYAKAPVKQKKRLQQRIFSMRLEMWRETGRVKTAPGVRWFLERYRAEGEHKWVIFARHLEVFNALATVLREEGIPFVRVDGKVKESKRQPMLDCITDPAAPERVALLTLGTCSKGITLCPGATRMVIFELIHTPDVLDQAEKRIHRIGCVQPVTIYWLIGLDTMDAHILSNIRHKQTVNASIIDGEPAV